MKKKICIVIGVFLIIFLIVGIIANYTDAGRVGTGHEPKYCIKVVNNNGTKVTYWGLGYKVIRYIGISPNEPYENNIGVKMGNWFMKYELPKIDTIKIEYEGKTIIVNNINDVGSIENILVNSKYNKDICAGINTHKIILNNEIYYIKESCKEIQKGDKQANITDEDLNTIKNIIDKKINQIKNDIERNINIIVNNKNTTSSNPFDYIKASQKEYNELLNYPKETFEYAITDLINTNANNGLKSYIEAILCNELNKDIEYNFNSANEFLEKYKKRLTESDSIFNDYDVYAKSLLK